MNKGKFWRGYGLALILTLALSGCGRADEGVSLTVEHDSYAEQHQVSVEVVQEAMSEELFDEQEEAAVSQAKSWAVSYASDGKSLTGNEASIYNALKTCIEEVARGERENTQFSMKTALSEEKLSQLNVNRIVFYLLNDCPFDLYWHDKTLTTEDGKATDGVYCKYYPDGRVEFSFKVSQAYRKSPDNLYQVNSASMDKVNHAKQKAQAIVDTNRESSDYDKLVAYKNAVCELVSYDAAALTNAVYGDAYQAIYVFDEDPNTNVVCEGYAKAFKYLCDLSSFDHKVECYVVSGISDSGQGAGEHMWNVVRIGGESGESYLIDITNCDAGTIGEDYELFMADNPEGSVDSSYTFYCNGWAPISYTYNAEPREIFGATILSLSNVSHDGQDSLHNKQINSDGIPVEGTETQLTSTSELTPTPTPEATPELAPTPEPTPTPMLASAADDNTASTLEQKTEEGGTTQQTSVLSFDVAELNKTYGDDPFIETVSGSEEDSKITYKSSDESVALIVNKKGKVRILKPGTATITATDSNGGATASYKLTVAKKPLTWNVSELYAVDLKDNINSAAEATLFGEMTIEGILESDKDRDSKFSFDSSDLIGTYTSTEAGLQKVILSWREGKKRSLNGEKADYYELPEALPELTGRITSVTVLDTPAESTDELMFELKMEDSISQVPETFLEDKSLDLDTPAKIQTALIAKIQERDSDISEDNIEVYDVTLYCLDKASDNEGDEGEWVKVSDEKFPEEGVTVTLPYPEGTSGKGQDFVVCHMYAEDMYLSSPGEVEYPEVTETDKGIQFKVYGLSPIAVGWVETETDINSPVRIPDPQNEPKTPDTPNTSNTQNTENTQKTDNTQNTQNTQNSQNNTSKSPVTADSSQIMRYLIMAAIALAFISSMLMIRLRKKKN